MINLSGLHTNKNSRFRVNYLETHPSVPFPGRAKGFKPKSQIDKITQMFMDKPYWKPVVQDRDSIIIMRLPEIAFRRPGTLEGCGWLPTKIMAP